MIFNQKKTQSSIKKVKRKKYSYFVWVKDGKLVQKGIEGATQITKNAWRLSHDKVWVKDGELVEKGTEGAKQVTKDAW